MGLMSINTGSCDIEYYKLENQSSTLVISFGGVNGRFEFYGSLSKLGTDFVLLRDPSMCWYQHGLNGVSGGFDGLVKYLKVLIDDSDAKEIIVIGASAGGYAAILFGCLLGASRVVAYGPQTYISEEMRAPLNERRWAPELSGIKNIIYGDLKETVELSNTNIHLFFGSDDFFDFLHCAWLLEYKHVTLTMIPNGDHGVSGTMKRDGLLMPSLKVALGQIKSKYPGYFINYNVDAGEIIRGLITGKIALEISSLKFIKRFWPSITGLDHMLAKKLMQSGLFKEASLIYANIANRVEFSNFVFMSQVDLGCCYHKLGESRKAEIQFLAAEKRKPLSQGLLMAYSRFLYDLDRLEEAESQLFKCIVHHPNYIGGFYDYALVLKKLNRLEKSINCLVRARSLGAELRHIDLMLIDSYLELGDKLNALRVINSIKKYAKSAKYEDEMIERIKAYNLSSAVS